MANRALTCSTLVRSSTFNFLLLFLVKLLLTVVPGVCDECWPSYPPLPYPRYTFFRSRMPRLFTCTWYASLRRVETYRILLLLAMLFILFCKYLQAVSKGHRVDRAVTSVIPSKCSSRTLGSAFLTLVDLHRYFYTHAEALSTL